MKKININIRHSALSRFLFLISIYYLTNLFCFFLLRFVFISFDLDNIALYFISSAFLMVLIILSVFHLHNRRVIDILLLIFCTDIIYILGERLIGSVELEPFSKPYLINFIIIFSLMFILYTLIRSVTISVTIISIIYCIISLVDACLIQFRGRSFDAIDIYSIRSAISVAGSYKIHITNQMAFGVFLNIILLIFIRFFVKQLNSSTSALPVKWFEYIIYITLGSAIFFIIFNTSLIENSGITPAYSSERNGFLFNPLFQSKYLKLKKPNSYDIDALTEQAALFHCDLINDNEDVCNPNIIVIMNESFCDYEYFGSINTNIEILPFLRSNIHNLFKGHVYSSIYSGNTAVSEYEFLTGDSNFLYNTMPYTTMIKGDISPNTFVSSLNQLGYETIAMHSYYNSAYRRVSVYQSLQFNKSIFIDSMNDIEYIRGFATDSSQYKTIYNLMDTKDKENRLFIFNVTMQNHGDYDKDDSAFEEKIVLTDYPGLYPKAEQYLSCVHASDKAFSELVDYLTDFDEPTIVLMFGDHQTVLEEDFLSSVGISNDSLQRYIVPYYIWANYDITIPEEYSLTSINYLSLILKETANLPLTGYDKYLLSLFNSFPVISSSCIMDNNHQLIEESNDSLLINYKNIIYNHICDTSNTLTDFFSYRKEQYE